MGSTKIRAPVITLKVKQLVYLEGSLPSGTFPLPRVECFEFSKTFPVCPVTGKN
jgi:hypothetical protein